MHLVDADELLVPVITSLGRGTAFVDARLAARRAARRPRRRWAAPFSTWRACECGQVWCRKPTKLPTRRERRCSTRVRPGNQGTLALAWGTRCVRTWVRAWVSELGEGVGGVVVGAHVGHEASRARQHVPAAAHPPQRRVRNLCRRHSQPQGHAHAHKDEAGARCLPFAPDAAIRIVVVRVEGGLVVGKGTVS